MGTDLRRFLFLDCFAFLAVTAAFTAANRLTVRRRDYALTVTVPPVERARAVAYQPAREGFYVRASRRFHFRHKSQLPSVLGRVSTARYRFRHRQLSATAYRQPTARHAPSETKRPESPWCVSL